MELKSIANAEEIVRQITESRALLEYTEKTVREPGRLIDLTCKLQLRDDCSALRRLLKKTRPDKMTEKDLRNLRLATERLKTTSENIFRIYTTEE